MVSVSIITPSFNSPYIRYTFESILSQTYSDWEWVVTDDGSSEEYIKTLRKLESSDARIKVFYNELNQGAGAARNNSIKHAKGRYIAFLDSDDLWMTDKLEKQIRFMEENDLALSYTGYQKFTDDDGDLGIIIPPLVTDYKSLLRGNVIGCLTAVYDSEKLGKCYMPLIRKRQDYGLWLSILQKTDKVAGLPEVLAKYRVGEGISANKLEVATWQWKFYREELKLPFFMTLTFFISYAVKGFIKHIK